MKILPEYQTSIISRGLTLGATALLFFSAFHAFARASTVSVSSLDLTSWEQGWGRLGKDKEVDGGALSIGGQVFSSGMGTHAPGYIVLDLGGGSERFSAKVGVNDSSSGKGSVEFIIHGDDKVLWKSGIVRTGEVVKNVDLSVKGVHTLILEVTDGGDGNNFDHADWAEAALEVTGVLPKSYDLYRSEAVVLTPKPSAQPRINGPSIFAVRPGSPFLYSIPVTGERPITYAVEGLPVGLALDADTGRITGSLEKKATYTVKLRAKNVLGQAQKPFRIVVGDQIALTPPMGWNSWNCWGGSVSQEKVLSSARALVEKGLNLHGWTYVNIDDGWQGVRGGPLNAIQTNSKFPDMKGLGDAIHGLGLKLGIYSTPWRGSYEGHIGGSSDNTDGNYDWIQSGDHNEFFRIGADPKQWNPKRKVSWKFGQYSFAEKDAAQWTQWGVDYLKYDWHPVDIPHTREMSDALKASGRDIVFSLSNDADPRTGNDLAQHANAWRTTGDITDSWQSMSGIGFSRDNWAAFQGPGHFNDPDMLVVGSVGWGNPHPTHLKPDEQYTHISLWALLGAPLLIGCDLTHLDDFTLGLLTNDEVLEVNQDVLGQQAVRVAKDGQIEVFAKKLEDGSMAVGVFNRGILPATGTVNWSDLKLSLEKHRVRDLWRQKDLGVLDEKFSSPIPPHGVVLIRIY